jgi:hypothetical protein
MTICVQVTNSESPGGRNMKVREISIEKDGGRKVPGPWVELSPGESRSFYIHLLKDIEVSEQHPEHV